MTENLDLTMIKHMLEEEREKLQQQLLVSSGNGRPESKNPDLMDMAEAYSDQERFSALQTLEQKQLTQIETALQAIVEDRYGRCHHCQKPIPFERLQILPYATMCVSCKAQYG